MVGPWAEEKLFYISRYMDIFSSGMKNMWNRRVYIDLFSGPGTCVVEGTKHEFLGSPLRAVQTKAPFTDLYLNDIDEQAINALKTRLGGFDASRTQLRALDCNEAALDVRQALALDSPGTIGLAVIDPTAFQIGLDAIEAMTRGRPIDLIVTVMTDHIRRFLEQPGFGDSLDRFFGSSTWRQLVQTRAAGGVVTYRALLDHYEESLRSIGYKHVDDHVRILNSRDRPLYHLVFASKHPRGADFFKKISQKRFDGQGLLDL